MRESARKRNRPQDAFEDAPLRLKRLRAVVLVVAGRHHHHEVELGNDADRLPALSKRGPPGKLPPIVRGTPEPPEIAIEIAARAPCPQPRRHRGFDPSLRNDLAAVPAAAREDELADLRHVARSQPQSTAGI